MRDGTLINEFTKLSRRTVMLYDQLEELHFRQEAMERVMENSTIKQRIIWAFSPKTFFKLCDAVQLKLHDIATANRAAAMAKAEVKDKIKIVSADGVLKP